MFLLGIDSTGFSYFFAAAFSRKYFLIMRIPKGFDLPPESGVELIFARCFGLRFLRVRRKSIQFAPEEGRATPVPLCDWRAKLRGLGTGFLKTPSMAGARMPQL